MTPTGLELESRSIRQIIYRMPDLLIEISLLEHPKDENLKKISSTLKQIGVKVTQYVDKVWTDAKQRSESPLQIEKEMNENVVKLWLQLMKTKISHTENTEVLKGVVDTLSLTPDERIDTLIRVAIEMHGRINKLWERNFKKTLIPFNVNRTLGGTGGGPGSLPYKTHMLHLIHSENSTRITDLQNGENYKGRWPEAELS